MSLDPQLALNEELPQQKYESYSSYAASRTDTLDEPILETVKRDLRQVYDKVTITMRGEGDYQKIRQEWDLWGPLVISLITAALGAFGTSGSSDEAFTNLFIGMWLGPLVITVNANLLGGESAVLQTLCLIIYCSAPVMLLAAAIFLMNWLLHSFLLNLLLAATAIWFVARTNRKFFESFLPADRKVLGLYPVVLFYTYMCVFLAMT